MDDWQLECCGDPFSVGERVSWTVVVADDGYLSNILGADADSITHAEEHHSDDTANLPSVTGLVRSIHVVHYRLAASPQDSRMYYPVQGSGVLVSVQTAAGHEEPPPGLHHGGYVIALD